MPEGHTIHRIRRDHRKRFVGQRLSVSSPQGRFRVGAHELDGSLLERVEAYGKHLFYCWERERVLHVHLGLYGKFRNHRTPPPEPRGAVRVRVIGERYAFDLNGPNRCELITPTQWEALLIRLGPDPLRRDAKPQLAWQRICSSRAAIGTLLLNQSVIAGVGNVYRAEVLHLLGIHPNRPGHLLSREEFHQLWNTLKRLLQIGVRYNRIITAPEQEHRQGGRGVRRQERLLVYKRDACRTCGGVIDSWKLGGRAIYACTTCQT